MVVHNGPIKKKNKSNVTDVEFGLWTDHQVSLL